MSRSIQDISVLVVLTSLTAAFSCFGDRVIQTNINLVSRCIIDNLTHAIIGGLSWTLITVLLKKSLIKNLSSIVSCFVLSSIIDLDHFLLAKSLQLNDAVNLGRNRPILHCTTLPVLFSLLLFIAYEKFDSPNFYNWAWILFTAFSSHHLRDGNRRGLWFYPFGSTQPIPYYIYMTLTLILPYAVFFLMLIFPVKLNEEIKLSVNVV